MLIKNLKLLITLLALMLLTSACSVTTFNNTGSAVVNNSSVFFSENGGANWRPMNIIPMVDGQSSSLNGLDVNVMRLDPEDSSAVYLASVGSGLYYTYNIVNGWNRVGGLPLSTINDVQVDPLNKCVIYAALANSLYRSADCARTWAQVYSDSNSGISLNTIAIDHANSRNVYIGNSRGDIIKSIDFGSSWRTINRLDNGIARLIISPLDSSSLFVATVNNKIFSFNSNSLTNTGDSTNIDQNFSVNNWTDLNVVLEDYKLGANFRDIIVSPKDGTIFLATDKLILRSPDKGITWENIKLIPSATDTTINAVAVNSKNPADIYYISSTIFFHSIDGGVTWKTQSLPAGRLGKTLLVDFKNPNNIYLGTIKLNK